MGFAVRSCSPRYAVRRRRGWCSKRGRACLRGELRDLFQERDEPWLLVLATGPFLESRIRFSTLSISASINSVSTVSHPDRIDRTFDMGHLALETAQHVDDGVHLADVGEKLIAQPFALACPTRGPRYRRIQLSRRTFADLPIVAKLSRRRSARRRARCSARSCRTDSSLPLPRRRVNAFNRVDFPTFGSPTTQLKPRAYAPSFEGGCLEWTV